jgi:uncharacterized protein with FMN-binding domain
MKKNHSFRTATCTILALAATLFGGCAATGVINPTEEATNTKLDRRPFGPLDDGIYQGAATVIPPVGTIVMGGTIAVSVTVSNGEITAIKREYPEDMSMLPGFEELPARIIDKGSLDVDGISGATYSSMAFLKAVEKAVKK